jgi:hypothetical protein
MFGAVLDLYPKGGYEGDMARLRVDVARLCGSSSRACDRL